MNGAAISQVPRQDHVQALQSAMSLLDGEQVEHRLGRVVSCAIPSIQDRNGRGISGVLCRTLSRVSHGDDVGVSIHHLDRIEQGLSLHDRGR